MYVCDSSFHFLVRACTLSAVKGCPPNHTGFGDLDLCFSLQQRWGFVCVHLSLSVQIS